MKRNFANWKMNVLLRSSQFKQGVNDGRKLVLQWENLRE